MKYDKKQLRATAVSVKEAVEKGLRDDHARTLKKYEADLATWERRHKDAALAALKAATRAVQTSRPVDTYTLRTLDYAPTEPSREVNCCTSRTKELDALIELLDALSDDEITANSLSAAGFKDLNRLLRRPC